MTWNRQVKKHTYQIGLKKRMPLTKLSGMMVCINY